MREIIVLLGYPAAGKSTLAREYLDKGYTNINRDILGGTLENVTRHLEQYIHEGRTQFILDNTYADAKSRASVIKVGKDHGIPVNCVWLDTSFEDAQLNACIRMINRTGRLLTPDDFKKTNDPNLFPPVALFDYRKRFEKPTTDEGFSKVEKRKFVREWGPDFNKSALILDYDGTLRATKDGSKFDFPTCKEEVVVLPERKKRILKYKLEVGYDFLLGWSNQSGIAKGYCSEQNVIEAFEKTNQLLDLKIDYVYCPHNVPPINCYCRKPHCGLGAWMILKYHLNPANCLYVGDQTTDQTAAQRCGFQFQHATEFFK